MVLLQVRLENHNSGYQEHLTDLVKKKIFYFSIKCECFKFINYSYKIKAKLHEFVFLKLQSMFFLDGIRFTVLVKC